MQGCPYQHGHSEPEVKNPVTEHVQSCHDRREPQDVIFYWNHGVLMDIIKVAGTVRNNLIPLIP